MTWLARYIEHPYLLTLAVFVAAPILWQYMKWLFGDLSGFISDATLGGLPDWYTFLINKYWEGEWAEIKIVFFLLLCIGFIASLYKVAKLIFY